MKRCKWMSRARRLQRSQVEHNFSQYKCEQQSYIGLFYVLATGTKRKKVSKIVGVKKVRDSSSTAARAAEAAETGKCRISKAKKGKKDSKSLTVKKGSTSSKEADGKKGKKKKNEIESKTKTKKKTKREVVDIGAVCSDFEDDFEVVQIGAQNTDGKMLPVCMKIGDHLYLESAVVTFAGRQKNQVTLPVLQLRRSAKQIDKKTGKKKDDFRFNLWERNAEPLYSALINIMKLTTEKHETLEELLVIKSMKGVMDMSGVAGFNYPRKEFKCDGQFSVLVRKRTVKPARGEEFTIETLCIRKYKDTVKKGENTFFEMHIPAELIRRMALCLQVYMTKRQLYFDRFQMPASKTYPPPTRALLTPIKLPQRSAIKDDAMASAASSSAAATAADAVVSNINNNNNNCNTVDIIPPSAV